MRSLRSESRMPNSGFSSTLRECALETAWSLWTELGVNGPARRHSGIGVDVEPLIVTTAYLSQGDARLREESLDWCVSNYRFVSSDRLRNYLHTADDATQRAFHAYAATVRRIRRVSWPGDGTPYDFTPTGRSSPPDLSRPALLQLRLRAVFGVSARAEVLRWLLDQPARFFGVLELSMRSSYGKDNVADTLDFLVRAGIVTTSTMTTGGNLRVFRINGEGALVKALESWATVPQQRWDAVFRIVVQLLEFASTTRAAQPAPRAVEIQQLLPTLEGDLRWLGTFPALRQGVEAVNDDFDEWAIRAVCHWANLEATERRPDRTPKTDRSPSPRAQG